MEKAFLDIFDSVFGSIREPLVVLDPDLKVIKANPSFYRTFDVNPELTEGVLIYDLGNRQWDILNSENCLKRFYLRTPNSMILRWNITLRPSAARSCI
jgi:PAS domain-containing protein